MRQILQFDPLHEISNQNTQPPLILHHTISTLTIQLLNLDIVCMQGAQKNNVFREKAKNVSFYFKTPCIII